MTGPHETEALGFGRRILVGPFKHEESTDDVDEEPSEEGDVRKKRAVRLCIGGAVV